MMGNLRKALGQLILPAIALLSPEVAALAAPLELRQTFVAGFPFDGVSDLAVISSPDEGVDRLAVVHNKYLLVLRWSSVLNGFEHDYFLQGDFFRTTLIVADADDDGIDDLIFADEYSAAMAAYAVGSGAFLGSFELPVDGVRGYAAQNIDGRPGREILVAHRDGVSAFRGVEMLWFFSGDSLRLIPASRHPAGHGDVFAADAHNLLVLDGLSGAAKRQFPGPCGTAVAGQLDFDANVEIVCFADSVVRAIDGDTGELQWSTIQGGVIAVHSFDANGDRRDDLILTTYTSEVLTVSGVDGALSGPPASFSGRVHVAGLTLGCKAAIAVVSGITTSDADVIHLLQAPSKETLWTLTLDQYGTHGMAAADLDQDGNTELLVRHDGKTSVLQIHTAGRMTTRTSDDGWAMHHGLAVAQLDDDAALEYVVSGSRHYTGLLTAHDGITHEVMWSAATDAGEATLGVFSADLDQDGTPDFISSVAAATTGAKGRFVYAFNGRDGSLLWRSVHMPELTGELRVAGVAADGSPELLVLSHAIGVIRLRGSDGRVIGFDEFKEGHAFVVSEPHQGRSTELIIATPDRIFRQSDGQIEAEVAIERGMGVTQMELADLDDDGGMELVVSLQEAERARLEVRSATTLELLWTSEDLPVALNRLQTTRIEVDDLNADGRLEIAFLSSLTLRIFELWPPPVNTVAPAFREDAVLHLDVQRGGGCCAAVQLSWDHASGGSVPVRYRVHRASPKSGSRARFLGTTGSNHFIDRSPPEARELRYLVEVIDAAGNAGTIALKSERLDTTNPACGLRRGVRR